MRAELLSAAKTCYYYDNTDFETKHTGNALSKASSSFTFLLFCRLLYILRVGRAMPLVL